MRGFPILARSWFKMISKECQIHLKDALPPDHDPRQVISTFKATVNMTPEELEAWLGTNQSRKAVESAGEEADREGRHAARRIVELLRKDEELFYEADLRHMHQITQYIKCHRTALEEQPTQPIDPLEADHMRNFGFDLSKGAGAGSGTTTASAGSKAADDQAAGKPASSG